MLEQWTGDVVGKMHTYQISMRQLSEEAHLHEKYISAILHGHRTSTAAERRIIEAVDRLSQMKSGNQEFLADRKEVGHDG